MIEIQSQIGPDYKLHPLPMYIEAIKDEFSLNQIVKLKITGMTPAKARSVAQMGTYWACCKEVAGNTDDPKWNTKAKTDFQCRVILDFRDKEYVAVRPDGTVQFKYLSIAFPNLKHMAACNYFDQALDVQAKFLGVHKDELVRMAKANMGEK